MADTYLELGVAVAEGGGLEATYGTPAGAELQESRDITFVDIFCTSSFSFHCLLKLLTSYL
jgi:hypothetical protein